jgi:hypothetical protein
MFYLVVVVFMAVSVGIYFLLSQAGFDFVTSKNIAGFALLIPVAIAVQFMQPKANRWFLWAALAVAAVSLLTMRPY